MGTSITQPQVHFTVLCKTQKENYHNDFIVKFLKIAVILDTIAKILKINFSTVLAIPEY